MGQVRIEAGKEEKVVLVLDGFHIAKESSAPIYGVRSDTVTISLKAGTENSVSDGEEYKLEDGEDEPDSPIFSKDNLTILPGTLNVTAREDGIKANNDKDEGKGNVTIEGGDITVRAGDDGINV